MSQTRNVPASVRQQLHNRAKEEGRPFQEVLQYYGMERFLYRLSISPYKNRFILKGALMLRVWATTERRTTKDIDLLGTTDNAPEKIEEQMRAIIGTVAEEDGLSLDARTVRSELITEEADYSGVRIYFQGSLDGARIPFRIDIGFGDIVHPDIIESELPTILDFPAPSLLCYSKESAIAEKFEAIVKLGSLNSRMKDFFDIWLLSRQFDFSGEILGTAISKTFEKRGTALPISPAFTDPKFVAAKQIQWKAFRTRMKQDFIPTEFKEITENLALFFEPFITAGDSTGPARLFWNAGSWISRSLQ